MSVAVGVHLGAPSYAAGSTVSATIVLTGLSEDPSTGTRSLLGFGREEPGIPCIQYVVVQMAGRWAADPSWIRPHPHPAVDGPGAAPDALDFQETEDKPWTPALDDANHVGGGGRVGFSGVIMRSAAHIVCELEPAPPGSTTAFTVECVLPEAIPATFRGTSIRYSYALNVTAALVDGPPQVVRVPFRVVTAENAALRQGALNQIIPVPTPKHSGPVPNRFLQDSSATALTITATLNKAEPSTDIEIALAMNVNGRLTPFRSDEELWKTKESGGPQDESGLSFIRFIPPPKAPNLATSPTPTYEAVSSEDEPFSAVDWKLRPRKTTSLAMYHISRGSMTLAHMYISKRVHFVGDTLSAIFDFQGGDSRCYRVNARLECQEVVHPSKARGTKKGRPSEHGIVFRKVYGEHGEFVMHNQNTHVTFSIPHDAPVSFATSSVHVRWLIHFIFLIPRSLQKKEDGRGVQDGWNFGGVRGNESTGLVGQEVRMDEDGSEGVRTIVGWEGVECEGDDSNEWDQLPQRNVDTLQWTLPVTVSCRDTSPWGLCSTGQFKIQRG